MNRIAEAEHRKVREVEETGGNVEQKSTVLRISAGLSELVMQLRIHQKHLV